MMSLTFTPFAWNSRKMTATASPVSCAGSWSSPTLIPSTLIMLITCSGMPDASDSTLSFSFALSSSSGSSSGSAPSSGKRLARTRFASDTVWNIIFNASPAMDWILSRAFSRARGSGGTLRSFVLANRTAPRGCTLLSCVSHLSLRCQVLIVSMWIFQRAAIFGRETGSLIVPRRCMTCDCIHSSQTSCLAME